MTGAVIEDRYIEAAARAMNLEAGRQRGLAFEDDWDTLTEQERGGWRLCAVAAVRAINAEVTDPGRASRLQGKIDTAWDFALKLGNSENEDERLIGTCFLEALRPDEPRAT